jgi:hypothetical protein
MPWVLASFLPEWPRLLIKVVVPFFEQEKRLSMHGGQCKVV